MKVRWVFLVILSFSFSSVAFKWDVSEKRAYQERRFVDLLSSPVVRGDKSWREAILSQMGRLKACQLVRKNLGGAESLLECIDFVNEEFRLGVRSPGQSVLIDDLNLTCQRSNFSTEALLAIVKSNALKESRQEWEPCVSHVWRQIFLTMKANIDSQGPRMRLLFRQAQKNVDVHNHWVILINKWMKNTPL